MGELSARRAGNRPRRWRAGSRIWVPVGIASALALAACGSSTSSPQAKSSAAPVSAHAARVGCGSSGGGSSTLTLSIGGHSRIVIVHVPSGYKGSSKVPLVLNMHGSGSTAEDQELFTGMDTTADADDFIVAYPQGLIAEGTGFDWNVPGVPLLGGTPVPAHAADDVTFLTQLVGVLEQRYCINPARVYATGFSGGARTASQLACDSSGVFAAVAPVSGLRRPTPCPTGRPVPIISFHGTADPVDPYGGHGEAYWTYSVPQAAQYWAQQDGCSTSAATSKPDTGVTLTAYGHCHAGVAVELYSISGEGHEWPGGPPLPRALTKLLGPQSNAISANNVMWAFFAAHPLP
jgi:polyhydroxybutyrate depolymerase